MAITDLNELSSNSDIKALPKTRYIELYESINSSRKLARLLNNKVSRGFLDSYYKDCLHKPYPTERICKKCNTAFKHLVKSRRDSTKICPPCKKQAMSHINKRYIKNKPSHKRLSNKNPKVLNSITSKLTNTFFRQVVPALNDERKVLLECICGKWVEETIKNSRKSTYTRKKSCGCKNGIRSSRAEAELMELVQNLTSEKAILNNKKPKFMRGLELDLLILEKDIAIEFHGLGIHSERPVFAQKDLHVVKTAHEVKYSRCKENGIRLIQIFEDEWQDKKDIIQSMIKSRLALTDMKIYARQCIIKQVAFLDERLFLNQNHISGHTNSKRSIGLYYNDELVSILTLRSPFTKKYAEQKTIEIARFASKLNTQVVGGFQKLLKQAKQWAQTEGYKQILTYADCRFGSGEVYEIAGFKHCGKTKPNYFYEKGGIREQRFKHKKNNDPDFIHRYGSTEREQNNTLGWYAIYDAGSEIYTLELD